MSGPPPVQLSPAPARLPPPHIPYACVLYPGACRRYPRNPSGSRTQRGGRPQLDSPRRRALARIKAHRRKQAATVRQVGLVRGAQAVRTRSTGAAFGSSSSRGVTAQGSTRARARARARAREREEVVFDPHAPGGVPARYLGGHGDAAPRTSDSGWHGSSEGDVSDRRGRRRERRISPDDRGVQRKPRRDDSRGDSGDVGRDKAQASVDAPNSGGRAAAGGSPRSDAAEDELEQELAQLTSHLAQLKASAGHGSSSRDRSAAGRSQDSSGSRASGRSQPPGRRPGETPWLRVEVDDIRETFKTPRRLMLDASANTSGAAAAVHRRVGALAGSGATPLSGFGTGSDSDSTSQGGSPRRAMLAAPVAGTTSALGVSWTDAMQPHSHGGGPNASGSRLASPQLHAAAQGIAAAVQRVVDPSPSPLPAAVPEVGSGSDSGGDSDSGDSSSVGGGDAPVAGGALTPAQRRLMMRTLGRSASVFLGAWDGVVKPQSGLPPGMAAASALAAAGGGAGSARRRGAVNATLASVQEEGDGSGSGSGSDSDSDGSGGNESSGGGDVRRSGRRDKPSRSPSAAAPSQPRKPAWPQAELPVVPDRLMTDVSMSNAQQQQQQQQRQDNGQAPAASQEQFATAWASPSGPAMGVPSGSNDEGAATTPQSSPPHLPADASQLLATLQHYSDDALRAEVVKLRLLLAQFKRHVASSRTTHASGGDTQLLAAQAVAAARERDALRARLQSSQRLIETWVSCVGGWRAVAMGWSTA